MATESYVVTSESVTEGHPDKICDTVADAILDAYLAEDPEVRINCEVLCKADQLVLAGEITSRAEVDREAVARRAVAAIGYTDPAEPFSASAVSIHQFVTAQSADIDRGVTATRNQDGTQGAGDQGMMFGYAARETDQLMPLPIVLAHGLSSRLAADRKSGRVPWMRPDGKTQVSVRYQDDRPQQVTAVVASIHHHPDVDQETIARYVHQEVLPQVLGRWYGEHIELHVNPTGRFVVGGPMADSGLTGRKLMVDTYGGSARHGGGSFSGKDASKVDRSGAYYCRFVAKKLVQENIAERVEIQVSYAIGRAQPVSLWVNTFGTGSPADARAFVEAFDFRPGAIIERLGLKRPIFGRTTNYGHFGKPDLPWEQG